MKTIKGRNTLVMPCEFVDDFFAFFSICIILSKAVKSSKLAKLACI